MKIYDPKNQLSDAAPMEAESFYEADDSSAARAEANKRYSGQRDPR